MESETSSFIAHRLARLLRLPSPDDLKNDSRTVDAYRRIISDFQNDPVESRGAVFQEQEAGGVFVIGPGNSCDFDFRSQFVGEEPDMLALKVRSIFMSNVPHLIANFVNLHLQAAVTGKALSDTPFVYPSSSYWVQKLVMQSVRRT
jgi:hypothetical protein